MPLTTNYIRPAGVRPVRKDVVVIRTGERGCLIMSVSNPPVWLSPFHESEETAKSKRSRFIDMTGAGNAFLGGFTVGHCETVDFVKAAHCGYRAASFVLEQTGVPGLEKADSQRTGELWNVDSPRERLHAY